ncbi:MAG: response regulator [Anaerolineae bacterium]|nr:response regulator [Anaerolineae bacterium]MCI0607891.1 response regulator [Anaerolineae bacterium]
MNTGQDYLLIVEDDRDILRLLDAALTFKGYRVIPAHNGREALEVIQIKRPAIVITDIMMPQLDGFGLVHRLRIHSETCDIPVVFITATYVAPEDREFALNIGATRFIQKPVDLEKFLSTIAELLEQDTPPAIEPLKEFQFYDGYRRRLEIKLDQKIKQIAREEHLLGTRSDAEDQSLQASLHNAIRERDELRLLLHQVYEQLEKYTKPE